jgi:hypothetical protein
MRDESALKSACLWTIKERDADTGLFIPRKRGKNLQTSAGLTAYAGAFGGSYTAPTWLVLDSFAPTLTSAIAAGATSLTLSAQADMVGDTQLVLSLGLVSQETVSFSLVTNNGDGTFSYSLSAPTTNAHASGDRCARQVLASDTMANVQSEIQIDAVALPGQRAASTGGYSGGTGNFVMQFYITGGQGLAYFASVGLADNVGIGLGNLHNHLILGYNHTAGNDVEVDVSLTLINA